MNIQLIGDNFDISDNTRLMVEEKISLRLDKLLSNFAPEMKSGLIRIQKTKLGQFSVNFDMNLPGKKHIYAETEHPVLESAFIDLEQEIERQIEKYKNDL